MRFQPMKLVLFVSHSHFVTQFYELNAGAVKILLDGQDESTDLPFTPGPKEHEIIHYQSDPHRSILLMGRSGTGQI